MLLLIEHKKLAGAIVAFYQVDPVTVSDDTDKPLGMAYPERGVMFVFAESEKVTPVADEKTPEAASLEPILLLFSRSTLIFSPCGPRSPSHGPYAQLSVI